MSDNIKLVIEIPKDLYEITKAKVDKNMTNSLFAISIVHHGIPLNDVLDKIEAEIKETRKRRNVGVMECLDIIDRYKAESEE